MEQARRDLTSSDLRLITSTQQDILGAEGTTNDSRMFRYCSIGASNVGAGLCLNTPTSTAGYLGLNVAAAVTVTNAVDQVSSTSNTLTVTNGATAITQDQFLGGNVTIISGTGAGTNYRIEGNLLAGANGVITLTLAEPLAQSVDTTSVVNLTVNPWANLATSTSAGSTADNVRVAGVSTIPMAANTFGWIQTEGYGTVRSDGTAIVYQGLGLKLSGSTAGEVASATGTSDADKQIIGIAYAHVNNSSTNWFPAYLQIY